MSRFILILMAASLSLSFLPRKSKSRRYIYQTGRDNVSLFLKNDSTFIFYKNSCMLQMKTKGEWSQYKDTIRLTHTKIYENKRRKNSERHLKAYSKYYVKNRDTIINVCDKDVCLMSERVLKLID